MSKWEKVKLGDICAINPPKNSLEKSMEVSFIPMSNVFEDGRIITDKKRVFSEVSSGYTHFIEDDILFAKITPCMENGKGAIARGLVNGFGAGSTEFFILRPERQRVSSEWIYRVISHEKFRKLAEKNMTGSAGQRRVPKAFLENILVPLPSIVEQDHITKTLQTVSELVYMYKMKLVDCENLAKSTFNEMFGDPIINEKKWDMKTINELCSKITDGEHLNPVFADSGVKMLMANNIQDELELTNCKYISESDHNKFTMKCNPEFGDILMVSRGATIGRACINNTTEKFSLMGSVILIKPNISFITNRYLLAWLRHDQIRDRIANTSSASAQQAIYMKDLKKKIIMCPPLPLQNQFAAIVAKIEEQKALVKQAIDETQLLFDSLMSKYFDD